MLWHKKQNDGPRGEIDSSGGASFARGVYFWMGLLWGLCGPPPRGNTQFLMELPVWGHCRNFASGRAPPLRKHVVEGEEQNTHNTRTGSSREERLVPSGGGGHAGRLARRRAHGQQMPTNQGLWRMMCLNGRRKIRSPWQGLEGMRER